MLWAVQNTNNRQIVREIRKFSKIVLQNAMHAAHFDTRLYF